MKIWIDITNSPHVIFFSNIIDRLKSENHEVVITSRNLSNTRELLNLKGWNYKEVSNHPGASSIGKILYYPIRIFRLYKYLIKKNIDISISHSSFHAPFASWLLNVPSIYLNDNEHAKGNYISFYFANKILLPESLKQKVIDEKWYNLFKISFYPGIKESMYLSDYKLKYNKNNNSIYIRPEPWTAEYYKGKKYFFDNLIISLSKKYKVYILPRGEEQKKYYSHDKFSTISVVEKPLSLKDIFNDCYLFIGAGGTMTRELAVLGMPTISIYQDKLLEVDKYLINNNYMKYEKNLTTKKVHQYLKEFSNLDHRTLLLKKGNKAKMQLIKIILDLNK